MRNDFHGFRAIKVEAIVDIAEFARFFLTGVTATVGNLSAIWLARDILPLESALLVGLLAGFSISFVMSKLYAFRSRDAARTPVEMMRFGLVYGSGAALYYVVGLAVAKAIPATILAPRFAELLAAFCGASLMTVTSYLGHRFFTYRRPPAAGGLAEVSCGTGDESPPAVGGLPHRAPRN